MTYMNGEFTVTIYVSDRSVDGRIWYRNIVVALLQNYLRDTGTCLTLRVIPFTTVTAEAVAGGYAISAFLEYAICHPDTVEEVMTELAKHLMKEMAQEQITIKFPNRTVCYRTG